MENFRKIRRPRPSLRRAWDHRRCGTWLFRRMALKRAVYFLSPQILPKPPKTLQNPPKPSKGFFGTRRPTHQGHIKHFFLGLQGAINIFLLRSSLPFARLQTLQNLTKPPQTPQTPQNPPKALLARLTPQANAPRPHQQLLLGLQGAITNFLWRSSLPFARLQTLQYPPKPPKTPKNSPKPSKGFFSTPDPAGQRTKATSTAFSWPSRRNQ